MSRLFRRRRSSASDDSPAAESRVPFLSGRDESLLPDDDLESSELAERLRRLDWPEPAGDVRERCLEEIMKRVESGEIVTAEPPPKR